MVRWRRPTARNDDPRGPTGHSQRSPELRESPEAVECAIDLDAAAAEITARLEGWRGAPRTCAWADAIAHWGPIWAVFSCIVNLLQSARGPASAGSVGLSDTVTTWHHDAEATCRRVPTR